MCSSPNLGSHGRTAQQEVGSQAFAGYSMLLYVIIRNIRRQRVGSQDFRSLRTSVVAGSRDACPERSSREAFWRYGFAPPDLVVPTLSSPTLLSPTLSPRSAPKTRPSNHKERTQHRSHFGSRYTLGCCVPARLFGLARWGKGEKMLAGG